MMLPLDNPLLQKSAKQWMPKKWSVLHIHDVFEEAPLQADLKQK